MYCGKKCVLSIKLHLELVLQFLRWEKVLIWREIVLAEVAIFLAPFHVSLPPLTEHLTYVVYDSCNKIIFIFVVCLVWVLCQNKLGHVE